MQAQGELLASEWPDTRTYVAVGQTVRFVVFGMPAPQGSKKFVGFTKPKPGEARGRAILVESSKAVKPWRTDVRDAAREARAGRESIDGPVRVKMVFTVPKPASAPKTRRTYAMRKPDLSKLCRATEDALVEAGLLVDDSRIVGYTRLEKVFPREDPEALEAPGVLIEIQPIG